MVITGRGYGMLAAGTLLVAGGTGLGYAELAALGAAALVVWAGAVGFVAWRPHLQVHRRADPDRVTRGEPSRVTLQVRNANRWFGMSVVAHDRSGRASVPVPLVRLRPGRATSVSYPVPTARRGVVEIGPLEINRRDPLGLVSVERRYGYPIRVWVRPRAHPVTAIPTGLARSMDGWTDRVPHGSITFSALRGYVVGDDLRQVHWRTSARVGEIMVREHVDTSLPHLVVLLDDRAGAHTTGADGESTLEAACEAAASVLIAAVRTGVRVELALATGRPSGSQPGQEQTRSALQVGALLDTLAEVTLAEPANSAEPAGGREPAGSAEPAGSSESADGGAAHVRGSGPLHAAAERLRARRRGDTLLYLTGAGAQQELSVVATLRGAYESVIAGIFGPTPRELSTAAGLIAVHAEDGLDFATAWNGITGW